MERLNHSSTRLNCSLPPHGTYVAFSSPKEPEVTDFSSRQRAPPAEQPSHSAVSCRRRLFALAAPCRSTAVLQVDGRPTGCCAPKTPPGGVKEALAESRATNPANVALKLWFSPFTVFNSVFVSAKKNREVSIMGIDSVVMTRWITRVLFILEISEPRGLSPSTYPKECQAICIPAVM